MQANRELPVTFHIIGDAFVDLFSFLDGDLPEHGGDSRLSQPIKCFAGGSSINTTTHLKSLIQNLLEQQKSQVFLQTVLNPTDDFGRLLLQHAQDHDFQLVNCRQEDDTSWTGHCIVIVSGGERSFMTHQGCVEKFSADLIHGDQIIAVDGPVHVHIAGFFNLVGFWHGKLKEQFKRIRVERQRFSEQSTTISLVAQHDASNLWDGGLDDLLPLLDFLILNELEANKIVHRGQGGVELPAACSESEVIAEWLSFFSPLSPQTCIVVTRGKNGATSFRNGEIVASTGPAVDVELIDPTGAGDSFAAGFLYGIWNAKQTGEDCEKQDELWPAWTIKNGLHFGCAAGTAAVMIRGASKPSNIETIMDLFRKQKAKEA